MTFNPLPVGEIVPPPRIHGRTNTPDCFWQVCDAYAHER